MLVKVKLSWLEFIGVLLDAALYLSRCFCVCFGLAWLRWCGDDDDARKAPARSVCRMCLHQHCWWFCINKCASVWFVMVSCKGCTSVCVGVECVCLITRRSEYARAQLNRLDCKHYAVAVCCKDSLTRRGSSFCVLANKWELLAAVCFERPWLLTILKWRCACRLWKCMAGALGLPWKNAFLVNRNLIIALVFNVIKHQNYLLPLSHIDNATTQSIFLLWDRCLHLGSYTLSVH